MSRAQSRTLSVLVMAGSLWAANGTSAQADMTLAQATTALQTGDHDQVDAAIQSLGILGDAAARDLLIARIQRGLPRDLLMTAIFTLGAMGDPAAGPVLVEVCSHRDAEVRARALETLVAMQAEGAKAALVHALADMDAGVRAAAARGLGELKASDTLDALFKAHERGDSPATEAIGKVIGARDLPRLLGYLGHTPLEGLAPALEAVITRKDIDEPARMQVVARLAELATREVKGFLKQLSEAHGSTLPPRLRTALLTAAQQIAD